MNDLREMSRQLWKNDNATTENINCGSLLRIADSFEYLSKERAKLEAQIKQLEADKKWYKEFSEKKENECKTLKSRVASYKSLFLRARKCT